MYGKTEKPSALYSRGFSQYCKKIIMTGNEESRKYYEALNCLWGNSWYECCPAVALFEHMALRAIFNRRTQHPDKKYGNSATPYYFCIRFKRTHRQYDEKKIKPIEGLARLGLYEKGGDGYA